MTTYQSVEQIDVKKHIQALYCRIRRLGIKCLVPSELDNADDNRKAKKDGNSLFCISGLAHKSNMAKSQMN